MGEAKRLELKERLEGRKRYLQSKQGGFTVVELVMVIVVLGILAAFALPKFPDFTTKARVATIEGLASAVRSTAFLAHSQQLAEGLSTSDPITIDGLTIAMSAGYPTITASGIGNAIQISDDIRDNYYQVYAAFFLENYLSVSCSVMYYPPSGGAPPVVSENISSCNQ